jgi:hypothetical protein
MGWAATDLRPLKQKCCDLIDEMEQNLGVVVDRPRMKQLEEWAREFPVSHHKLMALLKSQLMSGNKPTAKRLIKESIPDVRLAWWVQVALWPLVATVRVVGYVVGFLRPIGRLGKL